jgi:hypothetical protein
MLIAVAAKFTGNPAFPCGMALPASTGAACRSHYQTLVKLKYPLVCLLVK